MTLPYSHGGLDKKSRNVSLPCIGFLVLPIINEENNCDKNAGELLTRLVDAFNT